MRFASCTVCIRETDRAAARSGRGCGAGALGFSIACGCGRATRGAIGFATGAFDVGPDLPDKAEAGLFDVAVAGRGAGALDLADILGAAGRGLLEVGAGRAAGGGAWPYLLLLRLTMIFCGAFALGRASLLVGFTSFLGSRRAAFVGFVVGRRLFGGGGGGISSAESTSCSLDDAVLVLFIPGRDKGCCC